MTAQFFGVGCAGPGGTLRGIGYTGGLPHPGHEDFTVVLTNSPPFSLAALLVGTSLINVPIPGAPGCFLYTDLPFVTVLAAATDAAGSATLWLPMPCSLPVNAPIGLQWGVLTPGWNAFGWITSNDLDRNWLDGPPPLSGCGRRR